MDLRVRGRLASYSAAFSESGDIALNPIEVTTPYSRSTRPVDVARSNQDIASLYDSVEQCLLGCMTAVKAQASFAG